ncbi:MAG TPA: DUF3738 domain-containing protein [Bryobacteraceae bacterium]|nr:DUF3738 domain-containing protein [Bryobacteraceae bacterium]
MKSIVLLAGLAVAHAQSPAFDVISIKFSSPDAGSTVGSRGGPGTRTRESGRARTCPSTTSSGSQESGSEPPKEAPPPVPQRPSLGPDGFPLAIPGISGVDITRNRARGQWLRAKMERLVRDLDNQAGKPVVDATGLKGTYDFSLYWVPDAEKVPTEN